MEGLAITLIGLVGAGAIEVQSVDGDVVVFVSIYIVDNRVLVDSECVPQCEVCE